MTAAYTAAVAALGDHYHDQYAQGQAGVIAVLGVEEANLRHARTLARTADRWHDVVGCMQGLRTLYEHVGRHAEWAHLVDELTADLADPTTDQPLPGREEHWSSHIEYRVAVARRARDWPTATRLQHVRLAWNRDRARDALATPTDQLTNQQRHRIRSLAASEQATGLLLREQGDPACLDHYQQALHLFQRIKARTEEATTALSLGNAHHAVSKLQNLDRAEHWYRHALNRYETHDRHRRARVTGQLGMVAYLRFRDARTRSDPAEVLTAHLTTAARHYHDALTMFPPDATTDLATAHNQLGLIYDGAGQPDTALTHYRKALRHFEATGDRYSTGQTRLNVALVLAGTGRTTDALAYAHAALRDLKPYGQAAATYIANTQRLIAMLEAQPARP